MTCIFSFLTENYWKSVLQVCSLRRGFGWLHAITVDPSFSSHSKTKRSKQVSPELFYMFSCNHAGVDLTRYNGPDASGLTDITHRRSLADTIVGPAHHDNADWQRPAKSMPVTIKRLESFLADNRAVSNKRTVPLV
ncbi:hypothetical protein T10_10741 [Trichinella papuae]|uniref:Uncharacterized protein n=1 Tax=Trichinella papuae TaxID=268474 RepID=A0A0V1MR04_9BILA|nr:hypothetical protein T10_10741 [Trichinella papuae]